jgi:branched-chain amino acid transport system substrate-binding protein
MKSISRRDFLKLSAGAATSLTLLNACSPQTVVTTGRAIKLGYISPRTGALSGFGEADDFVLKSVREILAKGLVMGQTTHPVEIVTRDSKSDVAQAAAMANELITQEKIDLMVVGFTPDTTNPVSDQCETQGVPCLSSLAPWQPWYFRSPNVAASGYKWTYHFFWGLEDIIAVFLNLWDSIETNKVVGALWPNDSDGLAWSDPDLGFPTPLIARGFKVIDPGRYENLTSDFTPQITKFKEAGVEIVSGVMIPPDLVTFLAQAKQQGFKPKAVTVGKAALFPSAVAAIADNQGDGLTTEIWWSNTHPFKSSLTGVSAADLAAAYEKDTSRQWTQPLGFAHAMFEVAIDVLKRTTDIEDKTKIVAALKATQLDTIVGPIAWGSGPTPNVAKTPLIGGQWGPGKTFPWELTATSNATATNIPVSGTTRVRP